MNTEYTVQQVLETALGGPQMTDYSVSLLHSLIDIILKKLSCEHETVTVTGYESQCLQQLLRHSKISPLPFNTEDIQLLASKVDRLERLEQRMNSVDEKMRQHLDMVRARHNIEMKSYANEHWDHYSKPTETLCREPTPENIASCNLSSTSFFVRRLKRFTSDPIVDYLKELQKKLEALHLELLNFRMLAEKRYKKIAMIDGCIIYMEQLREDIIRKEVEFEAILRELQLQLDTKLDKGHKVALKLYIEDACNNVCKIVEELMKTKDCSRSLFAETGTDCLSCGGVKKCVQRPFHVKESKVESQYPVKRPPFCGCTPTNLCPGHERPLAEHMKKLKAEAEMKSEEPVLFCKPDVEVFEGSDGNFYRRG